MSNMVVNNGLDTGGSWNVQLNAHEVEPVVSEGSSANSGGVPLFLAGLLTMVFKPWLVYLPSS